MDYRQHVMSNQPTRHALPSFYALIISLFCRTTCFTSASDDKSKITLTFLKPNMAHTSMT